MLCEEVKMYLLFAQLSFALRELESSYKLAALFKYRTVNIYWPIIVHS